MAITVVQSSGKQRFDAVTAATITLTGVGAGHTLIVLISAYATGLNSDGDGTYTADDTVVMDTVFLAAVAHRDNVSAGTHAITLDFPGSSWVIAAAIEVSGLTLTNSLDQTAQTFAYAGLGSSVSVTTPDTGTTAQPDELVVGVLSIANPATSITVESTTPAWTEVYEELPYTTMTGEGDYKVVSAASTYHAAWTLDL